MPSAILLPTMRTSTETLISAMRVLAVEIYSEDGVANAAIAEAADRLEELAEIPLVVEQKEYFDGPWVFTYEDEGGNLDITPPTRLALYFDTYEEVKQYIALARTKPQGRNCKMNGFPLRRITCKPVE